MTTSLENLPSALLTAIVGYLDSVKSVAALEQTCKTFQSTAKHSAETTNNLVGACRDPIRNRTRNGRFTTGFCHRFHCQWEITRICCSHACLGWICHPHCFWLCDRGKSLLFWLRPKVQGNGIGSCSLRRGCQQYVNKRSTDVLDIRHPCFVSQFWFLQSDAVTYRRADSSTSQVNSTIGKSNFVDRC